MKEMHLITNPTDPAAQDGSFAGMTSTSSRERRPAAVDVPGLVRRRALPISPGAVAAGLSAFVIFLVLMHAVVMYAKFALGHDHLLGLVRMFDLLAETNVPTWYSTATLLASAALLGWIGYEGTLEGDRLRWYWFALAVMFVYLSLDEAAMVHERVQRLVPKDTKEALGGFESVLVGSALALGTLILTLPFLRALPRKTALLFVTGGALFVSGGIGIDLVGEVHMRAGNSIRFAINNGVEEVLEMFGIVVFIYALLDHIEARVEGAERPVPGP